ncbi:MAG TPA: hypothetical protein VFU14_20310 [Acidimicrobiales bacterium]|nr:hypothetical protein [Acidimicrobiales bacterium]
MTVTRRPTGAPWWPLLLVEGVDAAPVLAECLRLSADPWVGTMWVVEVGPSRADRLGELGPFEVVEHDGTAAGVATAVRELCDVAPAGGRPNVIVLDGSGLWDLVKKGAEQLARQSTDAQLRLKRDPFAAVEVLPQHWDWAKSEWWWGPINELHAWPGVGLILADSYVEDVWEGGHPVPASAYWTDIEKGTPHAVDATVRVGSGGRLTVTATKSLRFRAPAVLPDDEPLVRLIFDLFAAPPEVVLDKRRAQRAVLARARALGMGEEIAQQAARTAWDREAGIATTFDADDMARLFAALDDIDPLDHQEAA